MKKVMVVTVAVILICASIYIIFNVRGAEMAKTIKMEYSKVGNVSLNEIEDGNYEGSFGDFLVAVKLEVSVRDHKIIGIVIKEQRSGKGYEAREVINRIVKAQSPLVDVVSGASSSSKCIMIATYRALQK